MGIFFLCVFLENTLQTAISTLGSLVFPLLCGIFPTGNCILSGQTGYNSCLVCQPLNYQEQFTSHLQLQLSISCLTSFKVTDLLSPYCILILTVSQTDQLTENREQKNQRLAKHINSTPLSFQQSQDSQKHLLFRCASP